MANETDEIKQRLDLIELVREYVPQLKRVGANWKATCPFHQEKTPSFMVSQDKQIWHCFGCGRGGDHFAFLMEQESMDFPEALRTLAQKAGVQLKHRDPAMESKKSKLADLLSLTAKYYQKVLHESPKAEAARGYLKERNINETTSDLYQLGYAIDSWDDVITFLNKKEYANEQLFNAGLTVKKDKGTGMYNRFRDRLMFPFHDLQGNVIGFGGRLLQKNAKEAKYLNTPETDLYHKSAFVYGLHQARQSIKDNKLAIVVEGYMDVLASSQAGVQNVVASGGTALTEQQTKLIKRFAPTIALCFDADKAGMDAARRGVDIAWDAGLEVRVVELPFGKDPDEVIQKDPEEWRKAIAGALSFMEYYFRRAEQDFDLNDLEGKKEATSLLLPLIQKIPDGVEQTHYLQKLAKLINVEESILREKITAKPKPGFSSPPQEPSKPLPIPSRERVIAERLLSIIMAFPGDHFSYIIDHCETDYLHEDDLRELYKLMIVQYTQETESFSQNVQNQLSLESDDLQRLYRVIQIRADDLMSETSADDLKDEVLESIAVLKKAYLHRELTRLETVMRQAETDGDATKLKALGEDVQSIMNELADVQESST